METVPVDDDSSDSSPDSEGGSPWGSSTSSSDGGTNRSEPPGRNLTKYLERLALKYVNRGIGNEDAVVIFTFMNDSEKWRTSEERPAIIIPSEIYRPHEPVDILKSKKYDLGILEDAITYLASEIAHLEGIEPFVSCVDFGQYEDGREVDFVLSRHVHEALLYLHTCTILPSRLPKEPTIPVPARYYHSSCDDPSSSFETPLIVERDLENDCRYFDPGIIPQDTFVKINWRLGKEVREDLDAKLKLYWEQRDEIASHKAVIFTTDADLWATEKDPVIITSEPSPPIQLQRYDYDNYRIGVDIVEYVLRKARQEMRENVFVHYLRYDNGCVDYEVHLILMKEFVKVEEFMKRVRETPQRLSSQFAPVLYCTRNYASRSIPRVDVIWVERRSTSSRAHYSAQNPTEEVPGGDKVIETKLNKRARVDLDRILQKFIRQKCKRGPKVTVIFTKNPNLWKTDGNSITEVERSTSCCYLDGSSDTAREIICYLQQLAKRTKVGALNVSYLQIEREREPYFNLVLSLRRQPALAHLEECEVKFKPDVENSLTDVTKVCEGVYLYRAPDDRASHSPMIHVKVTRKFRGALDQIRGFSPF